MALYTNLSSGISTTTKKNKKNKKKKRTSIKIFGIILLLITTFLACLMTPMCDIKEVKIVGNQCISSETIISLSGISVGFNLFKTNLTKAKLNIIRNSYIKNVEIKRRLPNKVIINIEERVPAAYIQFMGTYICIDDNIVVLEIISSEEQLIKLPTFVGLKFNQFELGQEINLDDKLKLNLVRLFIKEIINNNLIERISKVDFNDIDNININIRDNLTVSLGDDSDIKYKISYLSTILGQLTIDDKGYINLENVANEGKATFIYDENN